MQLKLRVRREGGLWVINVQTLAKKNQKKNRWHAQRALCVAFHFYEKCLINKDLMD